MLRRSLLQAITTLSGTLLIPISAKGSVETLKAAGPDSIFQGPLRAAYLAIGYGMIEHHNIRVKTLIISKQRWVELMTLEGQSLGLSEVILEMLDTSKPQKMWDAEVQFHEGKEILIVGEDNSFQRLIPASHG